MGKIQPLGPEETDNGSRTQEQKLPFWWVGTTYFCEVGVKDEDETMNGSQLWFGAWSDLMALVDRGS